MKQSEKKVNSIDSVWGTLANQFKREKRSKNTKNIVPKITRKKKNSKDKSKDITSDLKKINNLKINTSEDQIQKIQELNDETDKSIRELHIGVDKLKEIALNIGETLVQQNEDLDTLQNSIRGTSDRMGRLNKKMRKL